MKQDELIIDRIDIYCVWPVVVLLIMYTQEQEQSRRNSETLSFLAQRKLHFVNLIGMDLHILRFRN